MVMTAFDLVDDGRTVVRVSTLLQHLKNSSGVQENGIVQVGCFCRDLGCTQLSVIVGEEREEEREIGRGTSSLRI